MKIHIHWYPKKSQFDFKTNHVDWATWKVKCRCGKIKQKRLDVPLYGD